MRKLANHRPNKTMEPNDEKLVREGFPIEINDGANGYDEPTAYDEDDEWFWNGLKEEEAEAFAEHIARKERKEDLEVEQAIEDYRNNNGTK